MEWIARRHQFFMFLENCIIQQEIAFFPFYDYQCLQTQLMFTKFFMETNVLIFLSKHFTKKKFTRFVYSFIFNNKFHRTFLVIQNTYILTGTKTFPIRIDLSRETVPCFFFKLEGCRKVQTSICSKQLILFHHHFSLVLPPSNSQGILGDVHYSSL